MSDFSLLEIKTRIQDLQQAIHSANPGMPAILRDIHTKLKADPAVITLLEEEDIEAIVSGLKLQTNVELTSAKPKTAKPTSAKAKLNAIIKGANLSADDF